MKRTTSINPSPLEIPTFGNAEGAGLPAEPARDNTPTQTQNFTIAQLSNRPPTPNPLGEQIYALPIDVSTDSQSDSESTTELRLANVARRNTSESEFSMPRWMLQQPFFYGAGPSSSALPTKAYDPLDSLKAAAESGDVNAQLELGMKCLTGDGMPQNNTQAFNWFSKAAKQGHTTAQYNLGSMFDSGVGVAEDKRQALAWYSLAAQQGDADAPIDLVQLYSADSEVKDLKLATYWLLKSGLTSDGRKVILDDSFGGLLEFIPTVLNTFKEFQSVKELILRGLNFDANDETQIVSLIKANSALESLEITDVKKRQETMHLLVEAFQFNTQLTQLVLKGAPSVNVSVDEAFEVQLARLLDQNKAIAELRQYLSKHPPANSDELPFEVLIPLADELIVRNIKDGWTREEAKAALDEFLLSAQIKVITAAASTTANSSTASTASTSANTRQSG